MLEVKHSLTVLLHDIVAGQLRLIDGKLSFIYSPEYLANPQAIKLSFALPLQVEAFDEQRSKAFFGGLLPEGEQRTLLSKQFGMSKQNDFALLREIGGECAGAVSLVLTGQTPPQKFDPAVRWLNPAELEALITQLPQRPMMAGQDGLRLSLAGAQEKLPVCIKEINATDSVIGLATNNQPSTHILKPPIHGVTDSVINEYFCMRLAKNAHLPVASTSMIRTPMSVLAVTRYDRDTNNESQMVRLHQEDFCQALGITSDKKYQTEGGPNLNDCFKLVREATNRSATSILNLLDYVIFNAMVGNHDAHGKNFSLLYGGDKSQLAPLYDCLSTAIYPKYTQKMAMSIGGKYLFSELNAKHWEAFATEVGLSNALTKKRLTFFAKNLPLTANKMRIASQGEATDSPVLNEICLLIEQRCALTIKRLSL